MASAEARAANLVVRYNALIESLRAVHRMLRRGRVFRGIQMLVETLDGVLSDDSESGESEADALAATLAAPLPAGAALPENVQQELVAVLTEEPTAAPAPPAFTSRSFRLD